MKSSENRLTAFLKEHWVFGVFFGGLYLLLLRSLLFGGQMFIRGDYALQFYPWAHVYAKALSEGVLPLWTDLIQCGYPLFAEGQTGMLYLPNLFLFKFFPLDTAYNLVFEIHFFIGGVFAYLYGRRVGMSGVAAALTAILFVFGSSYAGCFCNVVTLRTLVWFPLLLWLVEAYRTKPAWFTAWMTALVLSQSWLAGFVQMAAYLTAFLILYFGIRCFWGLPDGFSAAPCSRREGKITLRQGALFAAAIATGLVIATPQIWASIDLASRSTRTLQTPDFALWGSFAPWSALTLLWYPWAGFLRAMAYVGIFPLALMVIRPEFRLLRVWWVMAAAGFGMALGAFNPLYWLLIRLPIAPLMRNPSKFLFFAVFFMAVIAGFLLDTALKETRAGRWGGGVRLRAALWASSVAAVGLAVWTVIRWGEIPIRLFGEWYVRRFVLGRSYHRHSWETYQATLESTLSVMKSGVRLSDPFFWLPVGFSAAFAGWVWLGGLKPRPQPGLLAVVFLSFVCADLFVLGESGYGTGFLGNVGFKENLAAVSKLPADGRWLDISSLKNSVLPANRNMRTGHAVVGAYVPLMNRDYYRLVGPTGTADDSLGRSDFSPAYFEESKPFLRFLGVRYLAADRREFLGEYRGALSVTAPSGIFAFENPRAVNREFRGVLEWRSIPGEAARFAYLLSADFDPEREIVMDADLSFGGSPPASGGETVVEVLHSSANQRILRTRFSDPGYLVRNQVYDPGWKVSVDGRAVPLLQANGAFQAIRIPQGIRRVEWLFRPAYWTVGKWFYIGGLFLVLAGMAMDKARLKLFRKRLIHRAGIYCRHWGGRSKQEPVFIVAARRTGSNLLLSYLNSVPEISMAPEILNSKMAYGIRKKWSTRGMILRHILYSVQSLPGKIYGAKLMRHQLERLGLGREEILDLFPKARFLVVYRESILDQFVSLRVAEMTNTWEGPGAAQEPDSLRVEVAEYLAFEAAIREFYSQWMPQKDFAGRSLFLSYEELARNPQEIFDQKIFPFLRIPLRPVTTAMRKQGRRRNSEWVVNWVDMERVAQRMPPVP